VVLAGLPPSTIAPLQRMQNDDDDDDDDEWISTARHK